MSIDKRKYERIEIELPCRVFVPGRGKAADPQFEAFAASANLSLGGVFVAAEFLMKEGVQVQVELDLPTGPLAVAARVAHTVEHDHASLVTGMGFEFESVEVEAREVLLRYFTPERYHLFHASMVGEFPHLGKQLGLAEVSLVLNLWEEWKIQQQGGPAFTAAGAPPAPAKRRRR